MTNKQNFTLVIGEPGVGKSYELVSLAIQKKLDGNRIYMMTPTHSSKKSLQSTIAKRASEMGTVEDFEIVMSLQGNVHVGSQSYYEENVVLVDEIGQTDLSTFYALLLQLQGTPDADVFMFGDIKQLNAVAYFSPLEALLRENITVDNQEVVVNEDDGIKNDEFWQWVSDNCYDGFNYTKLIAPKSWRINCDINCVLLNKNYRLNALDYKAYDDNFFDDVINKAIEGTDDDYAMLLRGQLENHSVILVPTHKRGAEVDTLIKQRLSTEAKFAFAKQDLFEEDERDLFINKYIDNKFRKLATFVRYDSKVFLNPDNKEYDLLKQEFDGVPTLDDMGMYHMIDDSQYDYHAWATVHSMQGSTTRSITFFMGNNHISNSTKEHYSQNLLYTSITRASDEIMLLGLKSSFKQMRHQQPQSPQVKLQHRRAIQAKKVLFEQLSHDNKFYDWEFIYALYMDIFNNREIDVPEQFSLDSLNVDNVPYTEHQLHLQFKYYKKSDNQFFDYKKVYYTDYKHDAKSKSASGKRKSKVKVWLDSLDNEQLAEVQSDVVEMSRSEFKSKWNKDKRSVVNSLSE